MYIFLILIISLCSTVDSTSVNITSTLFLRDPDEITSSNNNFKLGFFSPPNSTNRYVGIWYNTGSDALDVAWVANRDNPLTDSSGVLTASEDGNLQVLDGRKKVLWSSNSTHLFAMTNSSVLQLRLLDTGNLVMSSDKGGPFWTSFDHPTDSFLPHMSMGVYDDTNNGGHVLRSWKSPSDPSSGRFTIGMTPSRTLLEVFIWDEHGRPYWRSGPWNGNFFIGVPMTYDWGLINSFRVTKGSLIYSPETTGVVDHFVLTHNGVLVQKVPDNNTHQSEITWSSLESECDVYGKCGPFGICNPQDSPICSCLEGFEPRNNQEWSNGNWTSGCTRSIHLQCGNADKFLRLQNVKVPDYAEPSSTLDNEENCRRECEAQCLCLAYAYHLAIGCVTWNWTLIDIQQFNTTALDVFVRLANSEPADQPRIGGAGKQRRWKTIVAVAVSTATIVAVAVGFSLWRWKNPPCGKGTNGKGTLMHSIMSNFNASDVQFKDLPLFKLEKLAIATNNFHVSNKLGQGGFGPVFKGKLEDGQEIAVKRLSSASGQGLQEFMNEVLLISKLQHRNLVKLLGCCVEDEEKMLVYEYMPNKSLDALLFDPLHGELLTWRKRFNIIEGICRGLLYLHRDSRLRIIHRDLKASNILLDEDLNPKISDFGMAKIYGDKEELGNTSRVVGTYGYICPEYAMEGRCSEKSDVYSFGVLLLEIISGRRNNSFKDNDESLSLLAYVWKLWNEDDILALMDPIMGDACHQKEISKCIQIGLLCVQEFPEDRPTISAVISMLDNEISHLPRPKQPGFTLRRNCIPHQAASKDVPNCSVYTVSVSFLSGR